jgi:hypothetical protein
LRRLYHLFCLAVGFSSVCSSTRRAFLEPLRDLRQADEQMRTAATITQTAMMAVKAMVVPSQLLNTQREFSLIVAVSDGEVIVVSKGEPLVDEGEEKIDVRVSTARS